MDDLLPAQQHSLGGAPPVAQNSAGSGAHKFKASTTLDQMHSKSFKGQRRDKNMQVNSSEEGHRRQLFSNQKMVDLQKQAQQPQSVAPPGLVAPSSSVAAAAAPGVRIASVRESDRMHQIDPRQELYGDQFAGLDAFGKGKAYQQAGGKCTNPFPGSNFATRGCNKDGGACHLRESGAPGDEESDGQGTSVHLKTRLPTLPTLPTFPQGSISRLDKREANQAADAEFREARLKTLPQQGAGHRVPQGGASFSAVELEKRRFAAEYMQGNEEPYAHVAALNRSVRGYDDTSKATLAAVEAFNAREQSRNAR